MSILSSKILEKVIFTGKNACFHSEYELNIRMWDSELSNKKVKDVFLRSKSSCIMEFSKIWVQKINLTP